MKDIKITDRWYVIQLLNRNGEWEDSIDMNMNYREAISELCVVNCMGRKARMIKRIAGFKVMAEKDFTNQ